MSDEHSTFPDWPHARPHEWREIWRELEAPPALDADDTPADPHTRAAVEWMRAAWEELAAPEPLPEPQRKPGVALRRLAPLAAAAAAVLLFWLTRGPAAPAPVVHVAAPPPLEAPRIDLTPTPLATPIRPHMREDGSVAMRSGKVLLILVEDPQ